MQKNFTSLLLCLVIALSVKGQQTASKATVGGSRWYSYSHYLDTFYAAGITGSCTDTNQELMWRDTSGQTVYTSGLKHVKRVSVGSMLHPQAHGFNDSLYYGGDILLDNTQAYTIDSIRLLGYYRFNPAKTTIVDTLVLSVMSGTGFIDTTWYDTTTIGFPSPVTSIDSFTFPLVAYDATTGVAAASSTPTPILYSKTLTSVNWGDTTADGLFSTVFVLTPPISVAASGRALANVSFRSGDASFYFGDTISASFGSYQYNAFFPATTSVVDASGTTLYAFYDSTDYNMSFFKDISPSITGNYYLPTRMLQTGGSAHPYQELNMQWHINCTTCPLIPGAGTSVPVVNAADVKVYPSPASDKLFIETSAANGDFTMTDVLGHVVLRQSISSRNTAFDISALPAGVYIYSLSAGRAPVTGRIAVVR